MAPVGFNVFSCGNLLRLSGANGEERTLASWGHLKSRHNREWFGATPRFLITSYHIVAWDVGLFSSCHVYSNRDVFVGLRCNPHRHEAWTWLGDFFFFHCDWVREHKEPLFTTYLPNNGGLQPEWRPTKVRLSLRIKWWFWEFPINSTFWYILFWFFRNFSCMFELYFCVEGVQGP